MVTLTKSPHAPCFGHLTGDCTIPVGTPGCARIDLSPLGKRIGDMIFRLPDIEPAVKVLQYSIMPDHVHILLFVLQHMRDPLGNVIARFKQAINQACDTVGIFNVGFNDQILKSGRSLDTLYRYIRENPRRLAARRQFPEYFRRVNDMVIAGHKCKLYGNMLLLRNPFKEQVVVHRADSQAVCAANHARWIYTAAITITNRPMEERYKPAGRDFELCEAGRLLIVSPDSLDIDLTRRTCMAMNSLAGAICTAV